MNNKELLLGLTTKEIQERELSTADFFYFLGKTRVKPGEAIMNPKFRGQSWVNTDELDYKPTQDIRNKVKPLLKKQARFMFGKTPDVLVKPINSKDKNKCEELRQFLDKILEDNYFWSETLKAFLMCTVTKRVLLRLECDPNQPIRIYYHTIDEFSYTVDPMNYRKIQTVTIVNKTINSELDDSKNKWNRYTYYINEITKTCWLRTEIFSFQDIEKPEIVTEQDTLLDNIPAWVIVNGGLLNDMYGESDITDLKDAQDNYNKKISDFADALRFQMFGQTVLIDATKKSANSAVIAPNALLALESIDEDHTASAYRVESSFSNADAIEKFLSRAEADMYEELDIPRPEQLVNIPSAKSLKYMYNDLISRCEEKWQVWEAVIKTMLQLIMDCSDKFRGYPDSWDPSWMKIDFTFVIKHNYPIPEDLEDKKKLGIQEVDANVRSVRSYIREFSDEEDPDEALKEIVEDAQTITSAKMDQWVPTDETSDNNPGDSPDNLIDPNNPEVKTNTKGDE